MKYRNATVWMNWKPQKFNEPPLNQMKEYSHKGHISCDPTFRKCPQYINVKK